MADTVSIRDLRVSAVIGVYVASRTTGLPFGPDLHEVEGVGALDVVSCALEAALIAGCRAGRVHGPQVFLVSGGAPTLFAGPALDEPAPNRSGGEA